MINLSSLKLYRQVKMCSSDFFIEKNPGLTPVTVPFKYEKILALLKSVNRERKRILRVRKMPPFFLRDVNDRQSKGYTHTKSAHFLTLKCMLKAS